MHGQITEQNEGKMALQMHTEEKNKKLFINW